MTVPSVVFHGIGVFADVAIGPAAVVPDAAGPDTAEPDTTDFTGASLRVHNAMNRVREALETSAAAAPATIAAVLEAEAMIARDPDLAAAIDEHLRSGRGITQAVWDCVEQYAAVFETSGGYMAERAADVRDIGARIIAHLLGRPEPGIPALAEPSILIARDLSPVQTAHLDPSICLGIVTTQGGPTSHTAVLAAQLGIPAVVRTCGLDCTTVTDGSQVAIDGGSGQVIVNPSVGETQEFRRRSARRAVALIASDEPGATRDGHPIALLANIGTLADAQRAALCRVEGVGLFRTEFLFLDGDEPPSIEHQAAIYTQILESFKGRRVIVRTLDAGSDKPLKFAGLGVEPNPALGARGLRLSMARHDLIDSQLEALAMAHRATGANLGVMAPMVATVAEARWFAAQAAAHGLPKAGIMVEVPSAALRLKAILAVVDFASIGTNDLQQYTMAADRLGTVPGDLLNPWQPAVLDLIRAACRTGQDSGKPVGVCGEAAGDPALALILAGLGATSLSMAVRKVRAVRTALAAVTLEQCRCLAESVLSQETPEAARDTALATGPKVLTDLL